MIECGHPHCSRPHIKFFDKAHDFLCTKFGCYHNWHHNAHHQPVHFGALAVYLVAIISMITSNLGIGTQKASAASATWSFTTASDYTYTDTKIQVSGDKASLIAAGSPGTTWIATDGSGTDWGYRIPITITGNGSVLTDYQILVTLNTQALIGATPSQMQSDCGDIRFTANDGATPRTNYWIEPTTCNTTATKIWVKVPSVSATATTIYLYYGGPDVNSLSSTANTFIREIDNVVGAWSLDEASGTDAADSSGNSSTGTVSGGATVTTSGKFGKARQFDGINGQVSLGCPDPLCLNLFGGPNINYEAWVNLTSGVTISQIVGKGLKEGLWLDAGLKPRFSVTVGGVTYNTPNTNAALPTDGTWHHLIGSYYKIGYLALFVDGIPLVSYLEDAGLAGDLYSETEIIIGNGVGPFKGKIDEVRIYSDEVADAEIAAIANIGQYGYVTTNYPGKSLVRQRAATEPLPANGSVTTLYPTDNPTIVPVTGQVFNEISAFTATLGSGNKGVVQFQISNDGTNWKYYNGGWVAATDGYTHSNLSSVINTNIGTFVGGTFYFKAFLHSELGRQAVELDNVSITYQNDSLAPTPTAAVLTSLSAEGGGAITTNTWYNHTAPYFSWTGWADQAGVGEVASGIAGYWVSFSTDIAATPKTQPGIATVNSGSGRYVAHSDVLNKFKVGADSSAMVSGSIYYLRIIATDNEGNDSAVWTPHFIYKFDSTVPTSPAYASASPSGYTATNSYTFLWPEGSDTGGSTLAGYKYKTGAGSGAYSAWSALITTRQVTLVNAAYQQGPNIFYLQTLDNAGNTSQTQATFYYNTSAPTAPTILTVNPSDTTVDNPSATNSFSFSWAEPDTYQGSISKYHYSINVLPTADNTTEAISTSLTAGAYATQQGKNTFYIVAEDESKQVNYSLYALVDFYVATAAPGIPLNVEIFDTSNKDLSKYRVSIEWTQPTVTGLGFSGYDIYRSTNGTSYSLVGSTSGNSYSDSNLSSTTLYYYYIISKDDAGRTSASSSIVSITPEGIYRNPPILVAGSIVIDPAAFSATASWSTEDAQDPVANRHLATGSVVYSETEANLDVVAERNIVSEDADVLGADHELTMTGLQPETLYYYQLKWKDANGNIGESNVYNLITEERPNISDFSASNITLNSATISYKTNYPATTQMLYGKSSNSLTGTYSDLSGFVSNHTVNLKDIDHTSKYYLRVIGQTVSGDPLDSGTVLDFTTLTKPLVVSFSLEQVPDMPVATWRVAWKTNVETTSIVEYQREGSSAQSASDATYSINHDITLNNLGDKSVYSIKIAGNDRNGNAVEYSDEVARLTKSFETPQDSRPPRLSNLIVEIRASGISSSQKAQIVVSWETDEPSTSQVEFGPGIASDSYPSRSLEDATKTTNHVVIMSELEPAKLYHLRALSADESGNIGKSTDTTAITGKVQKSVIDLIFNSLQRSLSFLSKIPFIRN